MPTILSSFLWIAGASVGSFLVSAVFSGYLKWPRRIFLFPYIILSALLLVIFFKSYQINAEFWIHNWFIGLFAFILIGALLVKNVWSQPDTRKKGDNKLFTDILWLGLAYGVTDGLLLNVMPVIAANGIFKLNPDPYTGEKIILGIAGIAASLAVTLFYHLGYHEFRNKCVLKVLLGNALITLTFVISGNPLAAVLSHATMHIAAVLRGPDTTIQLPPHY